MKQRKSLQKPVGTVEYQVAENDTIEKIALKWNTIPSEIQHLNRLVTRTIFPGQLIYVPDPNYVPPPVSEQQPKSPQLTKQLSLNDIEKTPSVQTQNPTNTSTSGGFSFLRVIKRFYWGKGLSLKSGHRKRNYFCGIDGIKF